MPVFPGNKKNEFVTLALMLSSIFSLLIFVFGIFLSHHFYGPIYKLNKYVENNEWDQNFILREKDQFKELEALIKNLKKEFVEKNDSLILDRFRELHINHNIWVCNLSL